MSKSIDSGRYRSWIRKIKKESFGGVVNKNCVRLWHNKCYNQTYNIIITRTNYCMISKYRNLYGFTITIQFIRLFVKNCTFHATIPKSFIESHAPVQKRYVTLHPSSPWFTDEIYQLNVDGMLLSYQCIGRSA